MYHRDIINRIDYSSMGCMKREILQVASYSQIAEYVTFTGDEVFTIEIPNFPPVELCEV